MENKCSVCRKPVEITHDKTNVCSECGKAFCEDHNTVGNQWNGKDRETEHLATQCEDCAIAWISGQADYLKDFYDDRHLGVRVNVDELDEFR